MDNPWNEIDLNDYESHMRLPAILQLQTLDRMMAAQFRACPASSVMILGVAGGNGLGHIQRNGFEAVYGVDINASYLEECARRYPGLRGVFFPIAADLREENLKLPNADLVIANLVVEYIGYRPFQNAVRTVAPKYVSCAIQNDSHGGFVSDSPYQSAFDRLGEVLREIDEAGLTAAMADIGYRKMAEEAVKLPNGKALLRLDYGA